MIPKLKMPGSKHSVLGIIQVTIDKIIVSITGFTTIDHRGTIALDEKLLNPTISQVTGSRINIKGKKGILDPVNNCQSIFVCIIIFDVPIVSIRPRACFSPSYNKVKSQTKHVWLLTLL